MSLRLRSTRPFAWIALGVFLCGWVVPFFEAHPLGFDEDTSGFTELAADTSAGRALVAESSSDRSPAHCVLCHLMRALNGSMASAVAQVAAPGSNPVGSPDFDDPAPSPDSSATSSRGPPAVL